MMNEANPHSYPERPSMEQPEHIRDAVDAVVSELAQQENGISIREGVDWLLSQQSDLYERHRQLRAEGKTLPSAEEKKLEDINFGLLSLKQLYEKYHPEE